MKKIKLKIVAKNNLLNRLISTGGSCRNTQIKKRNMLPPDFLSDYHISRKNAFSINNNKTEQNHDCSFFIRLSLRVLYVQSFPRGLSESRRALTQKSDKFLKIVLVNFSLVRRPVNVYKKFKT